MNLSKEVARTVDLVATCAIALVVACGAPDARAPVAATIPASSAAAVVVTPVTAVPSAEAPSAATAASAPQAFPPPRPATIPLGDGELAAGDAAFERSDLAGAEVHYLAAPKGIASRVGLARVTMARAGVPLDFAAGRGNVGVLAAEKELAAAVAGAPPFGPAFVELGRARLLLGDAPGALVALRKGADLLPTEPEAQSQLGVALLATGHAADSVIELARACALDPGNAARHGNLGTALMMAGRTREAITEYETTVRMDDTDAKAHSDLGTALLGASELDHAVAELERAVAIDPRHASYHSNLGFALQQAGQLDRATAEYKQAIALDSTLASPWINLATVLARDPKRRSEARSALMRANALSPDDPRVKENLRELDALRGPVAGQAAPSPTRSPGEGTSH